MTKPSKIKSLWQSIGSFFKKVPFPSNVIVTATHGSYKIPLSIFPKLSPYYQTSPRLLLNFSDYGTKYLVEDVPSDQKVIPAYGRLIGDPNRSKDSEEIIRFKDFGGNAIFSEKFTKRLTTSWFHSFWLNKILKLSYHPYYKNILETIKLVSEKAEKDRPILLIDVHDTGNLLLGPTKKQDRKRKLEEKMPKVVLSNAPDEEITKGCFATAPDYLMEAFQELLAEKLEFKAHNVRINHVFLGGNIIRHFGNTDKNEKLQKALNGRQIYAIQVEFDRGIYMNEQTQRPIKNKIRLTKKALMAAIIELEKNLISVASKREESV